MALIIPDSGNQYIFTETKITCNQILYVEKAFAKNPGLKRNPFEKRNILSQVLYVKLFIMSILRWLYF